MNALVLSLSLETRVWLTVIAVIIAVIAAIILGAVMVTYALGGFDNFLSLREEDRDARDPAHD